MAIHQNWGHTPLSETRHCDYPCGCRDYYTDLGRVYAFAGCVADVDTILNEYMDCKKLKSE